jgi:hypothetical protein
MGIQNGGIYSDKNAEIAVFTEKAAESKYRY